MDSVCWDLWADNIPLLVCIELWPSHKAPDEKSNSFRHGPHFVQKQNILGLGWEDSRLIFFSWKIAIQQKSVNLLGAICIRRYAWSSSVHWILKTMWGKVYSATAATLPARCSDSFLFQTISAAKKASTKRFKQRHHWCFVVTLVTNI